jgi:lipoprotein NlpI
MESLRLTVKNWPAFWSVHCSVQWPAHRAAKLFVSGLLSCLALFSPATFAQQASNSDNRDVKEVNMQGDSFIRSAPYPAWIIPILETPKAAPSGAIQSLYSETQFLATSKPDYLVVRAFQVNDQSALKDVGQYPIDFAPAFEKVRLHSVKVIRGSEVFEKTAAVNVRFLQREVGFENGVYSGTVTAVLLTEDVRVGDIFFVAYSKEGVNPVLGPQYANSASWDTGIATGLRRVVLMYNPNKPISWQLHGDTGGKKLTPKQLTHGGNTTLIFEESNLAPLTMENGIPSDFVHGRYLQFSDFKNWQEVAQWGVGLFPALPANQLPVELNQLLSSWEKLPTQQEKTAAALRWVQDEIRYFSVSIGESSHRPYQPSEIVKRRYGDCKDKTYLLITLLKRMGIEAHPVLVTQNGFKSASRSMPTSTAFDHVVTQVVIDGIRYYLDGTRTGQRGSIDKMGWAMPGALGLVLAESTKELIAIESGTAQNATQAITPLRGSELSEVVTLSTLGADATFSVVQTFFGLGAEGWRSAAKQYTAEQKRQALSVDYEKRYPGIRLQGEPIFQDDESQNKLTITSTYIIPNLAREDRGDWFFRFFPNNLIGSIAVPQNLKRQTPAVIAFYPYSFKYKLTVNWPSSISAVKDPFSQRLSNDFFIADLQRTFRGNVATASVNFEHRNHVVKPQDMNTLAEEVRKLERLTGGVMFVEKAQIKSDGFLGFGRTTLQQSMTKKIDQTIDSTSKVIRDKSLTGDDLAETYCERAISLADRGKVKEALVDANEAVKIAPNLASTHYCRMLANLYSGNFANAIPDATKALSLGANAAETLYRRGMAKFYLDQYDAAAIDFDKAATLTESKEGEVATFQRLWQAWALLRAGKPLPTEIKVKATDPKNTLWPQPALAMAAGLITPEELITIVNRKTGDERELSLVEAWFYVGQYQLIKGDLEKAKTAFEAARQSQITMYVEHTAAGFELAKLNRK